MSTHDVESPTLLIEDVCKYSPKNVKPLGTVLSICQQKGGGEYVKSRKTLDRLSKSHLLPPLFSTNAGIAYSTDAKNALNPLTGSARTLKNKYTGQTQVLYKQIQTLANELVNRVDGGDSMDLSFDEQANQSYEDAWHA
jgi:hypothetical protein